MPPLTPAQTLALKRLFCSVQGGRGWASPVGSTGQHLHPRVAKALGTYGLVENRTRTLRSGRVEYSFSYLTWRGAYVAWELCGCPALDQQPRWTGDTLTFP
jgi:hypothetical protein